MSKFNSDLIDDLARQRVVIFAGAGVSSSALTPSGASIKGWDAFLQGMLKHVNSLLALQVKNLLDKKDYLLACELLQRNLQDSWENHVTAEFGQMAQPSRLHEALIGLDQRLILTTNFDKLIESCWISKIGNSTHLPIVVSGIKETAFKILKDHSRKYLVKIHGTVDQPETLIFSRSEYIRMAFGNSLYSSFLEILLLTYTFLFVGFSMEDPAITSLMEMYALRYPNTRPHYIISPSGLEENIKSLYRTLRRLAIIEYDASLGYGEVPRVVDDLAEEARTRRKLIYAGTV